MKPSHLVAKRLQYGPHEFAALLLLDGVVSGGDQLGEQQGEQLGQLLVSGDGAGEQVQRCHLARLL